MPREREGTCAYKIIVPEVFGIIFVSLVSCMSKDSFNLIILFLLRIGIHPIAGVRLVELLKVLDVVGIVGYFDTPA
jgi:hypothetical protein